MNDPKHVLVVGGGYTGLTAAWQLSRIAGLRVTLLERSSSLGGLAGGFTLHGTSIERAYHHLFRTDADILRLIQELGITDTLEWCNSSLGIYLGRRVYPFMSPWDLLRFRPCGLLGRLRVGIVALYLQRRKDWRSLASQTAYEWMARACGRDAMRTIWEPLLRGKFGRYYSRVSMAWLWARIHVRGNSRKFGGVEQLGYFIGGFEVLTRALEREFISRGGQVRRRTALEQFSATERRALIQGKWETFDACVFTGPSYALARLLPQGPAWEDYAQQLRSIDYLSAVLLVFSSNQIIGDQYWLNVNESGAPFLVFLRHTRLVDAARYAGKQVYYIGAYVPQDSYLLSHSDDEIASLWWDYLMTIYPIFDPKRVVERHVFKFHGAQHVVDTAYESRIPAHRTPLPGVFLANFSQVFPEDRGTNYAVREGRKIADLVLTDLRNQPER